MKILALETATEFCSVALLDGDTVISRFEAAARTQTQRILPMVEDVLAEAGTRLAAVDAIAFSQGPGAFTGVRVATAVAQGLAFSAGVPLVGVSTLASCALAAARAHGDGHWLAGFDARMGEVYLGGWAVVDGALTALLPDCLCAPQALPALPAADWRGAGSACQVAGVVDGLGVSSWFEDVAPTAETVASLAVPKLQRGETMAPEQAVPVYLRDRVIQGAVK